MNKKSFSIGFGLLSVILVIVMFYAVLWLPLFAKLRITINYFLIILLFIILQVGIVFGYYKLGFFFIKGFDFLKNKMTKFIINIHNYIVIHS
jgi:hypothetical protein